MAVKSARTQLIIRGDDVTLKHQIMGDIAYDAELSRAPITLLTGDTVNFFYPLQDGTIDLIGYPGVALTVLPCSEFSVDIAGDIPAVPTVSPERGTKTFQSGLGLTVRAEITRADLTKESYYLYQELDCLERGFPIEPQTLNLP